MSSFTDPSTLVCNEAHLSSIGKTSWSAPSNIALVKYWGKFGDQLPCNPSLSITLEHARTQMSFAWRARTYTKESVCDVDFLFEGKAKAAFAQKIQKHLVKLSQVELPFLKYFDFQIEASNTFPHSSGIASSASSMAALSCCLGGMIKTVFGVEVESSYLSRWARLGSGSAARSLYSQMAIWGVWQSDLHQEISSQTTNDFAIGLDQVHPSLQDLKDAILIVDDQEKSVSSRAGHALMENHPHAKARFARAHQNLDALMTAMKTGDLMSFCQIVEAEALELHGLMMTSEPPYILMKPQTLAVISKVQKFREESLIPLCFTLDAGANVHLLYPASEKSEVEKFINDQCLEHCVDGRVIFDQMGTGLKEEKTF